ncbi:S1C family serine protease [Paenibacillus sp. MSJ-34]|uniref:S1C family serine protease n=1 Tax=Paenibacillus sp. MSJ-34 TaxID=2841529 RepID=UPI001C110D7C|nr:trypsin-like peptidase domain-containing protein [Paenibacillus sp. MSJ-34]MBU5442771.1 trypsin-like peptidase domain-containing protein [Paenibacillus sp. MSJ-34]
MSEDKRNDEQGLFHNHKDLDQEPAKEEEQERPSYYYSYGPFKSVQPESPQATKSVSGDGETSDVDITPPEPIRSIPVRSYYNSSAPAGNGGANHGGYPAPGQVNPNWQYSGKAKSPFKSIVASFLAGMLVVGTLMFAADRGNWFTPGETALPNGNGNGENAVTASANPSGLTIDKPGNVAAIAKQASPAVVLIETFQKQSSGGRSFSNNPFFDDPFFRQFFGDNYPGQSDNGDSGKNDSLVQVGIGSGFIFDKSGYILTNQHVIGNADSIKVTLQDYKEPFTAKLLGSNFDLDLAVLKIEGDKDFPSVNLGDSDQIQVGDWVVAIGNPLGFDHTVTAGVLSAKDRKISIPDQEARKNRNYKNLLQTDASINPGNSGGPLLNTNGEVIGMNVAVSAQGQGIGFAIPSKTILEVVEPLKANKEIPKEPVPFIGADLATMTEDIAKELGVDFKEGSIVSRVYFKSPAYNADLRPYDIITGIDGTKYKTNQDLIDTIQTKKVGEQITLHIIRDGKTMDLKVTIGDKNKFGAIEQ